MRNELSVEAKQTFQIVALLATIAVVGVHYKTDVPDGPDPSAATLNQLAQEFLLGGMARVAVPIFAFAAGFFYFRSDDCRLATYLGKLKQRLRTVWFPFFVIASIATSSWLLVRRIEGDAVQWTTTEFLATWLLRPPAEQLWFLRDLMVLVTIAPLLRFAFLRGAHRHLLLVALCCVWACNLQVFPVIAGWHLLHTETLLFFVVGGVAVSHIDWIECVGRRPLGSVVTIVAVWCGLIAARICVRADFDIWYVSRCGPLDLALHQASIVIGCVGLFMIAWRIRHPLLIRLSGASFFVFLIHEFPLRAAAQRCSDRYLEHSTSCWIVAPMVVIGCYLSAILLSRHCPGLLELLTGGRTPGSAARISRTAPRLS